ncbi:MAG: hypothetical protein ACI8QS_002318 [Planctomycetota bacterium]
MPRYDYELSMRTLHQILLASALLIVSGCVISIGGDSGSWGWHSNLRHEHVETIELPADCPTVTVNTGSGDVHVQASTGPARMVVVVREEIPGDAYVVFEGGELQVRSQSGQDVALGDVEVFLNGSSEALTLSTGSGTVIVEEVGVTADLLASTGSGDVLVQKVGSPTRVVLATGSGDVCAVSFSCSALLVDTGSGDIDVRGVQARNGSFDTGSGDVRLERSSFEFMEADTGSGDVDARSSEVKDSSVSTGSGSVHGLN